MRSHTESAEINTETPPPATTELEEVTDAEGAETVLYHNQTELLRVIMAILTNTPMPAASLRKHIMECGQAAENQAIMYANLKKFAGEPVNQEDWTKPMNNLRGMTAYCHLTQNQCVMLEELRAKNPNVFVVVQKEQRGCCCAVM